MRCSGPRPLDQEGEEVSLAYWADDSEPGSTADGHLLEVRKAAAGNYANLTCEPWAAGRPTMVGLACRGTSTSPQLGDGDFATFIGLEEQDGWWLKLRATVLADDRAASEQAVVDFVSAVR